MNCWETNFTNKSLKDGFKHKNEVENLEYDGYTLKASVKSYDVELIIQDNILYDMSCTCKKKSSCAHEASVLYFLDEFPEILQDLTNEEYSCEKIAKINVNDDLKIISKKQLTKFLKKEFKKNPKLKYHFITYFSEEPLIDKQEYVQKLKGMLKGKRFGYYDLSVIGGNIKKFMKNDISFVINQGEYELAYTLLTMIMDIFIDQLYWDENNWYDIAYYYREYCYDLFEKKQLTTKQEEHLKSHLWHINNIVF